MKRRRNLLVVLLLVCAIGLGVGYATITGDLIVTGKTTIEEQDFDVVFTDFGEPAYVNEKTTNTSEGELVATNETTLGTGAKEVTFNVRYLKDVGDKVTVKYTITNYNDCKMYLKAPVVELASTNKNGSDPVYYSVTPSLDKTQLNADGDTATLTITVELIKLWIDPDTDNSTETYNDQFTVTVNASSTAP